MDHPMDHPKHTRTESIPMFNRHGTALSEEDRAKIAQKRGQCVQCGIKTADVKGIFKRVALNTEEVHNGTCIRCNRDKVPADVYAAWEAKFQPKPAASPLKAKLRAAVRGTMFANQAHAAHMAMREPSTPKHSNAPFDGHSSMPGLRPSTDGRGDGQHSGMPRFHSMPPTPSSARSPQFDRQAIDKQASLSSLRAPTSPGDRSRGSIDSQSGLSSAREAQLDDRMSPRGSAQQLDGHSSRPSLRSREGSMSSSLGRSSGVRSPMFDGHSSLSSLRDSSTVDEGLDGPGSFSSLNDSLRISDRPRQQLVDDIPLPPILDRKLPPDRAGSSRWLNYDHSSRENIMAEDRAGEPSNDDVFQVLKAIQENRHNPDVLKKKLYQLRNLEDDRADSLYELKDIMSEYRNDSKVLTAATGALWSVTADHDEKKMEVAECGAIDCILDALRNSHTQQDAEFDEWAIGSLACLARGKHNREIIGNLNGMETILDTLKIHQISPGVFEWSCRALHSLVHQYEEEEVDADAIWRNLTSIDEHGGVSTIVSAMKIHYLETVAQGWAMQLLLRLLDRDTDAAVNRVLSQINQQDGIAACVKVLKARSTTPEVFSYTAELMANLIVEAEADKNHHALESAADCIHTVVRVMKENVHIETLQESSSRLLSQLATEKHRPEIKDCKALAMIVKAMAIYTSNLTLHEAGSWTLWSMSFDPDLVNPNLVKDALNALNTSTMEFPHASLLLAGTCGFIGNLCSANEANASDTALKILIRAVSMNDPVEMVGEQASRALATICASAPSKISHIFEGGGVESIMNHLRPDSLKASSAACKVLIAMADTNDTNKEYLIEAGCLDRAVALLRASSSPSGVNDALELISVLLAWEKRQSVRLPSDSVSDILEKMETLCNTSALLVKACGALTNLLLTTATESTALSLDGIVESMTNLIDAQENPVEVRHEACGVLWAFVAKQRTQNDADLSSMFRSVVAVMRAYKGDDKPFNSDLQSMAAGALEAITARLQDTTVSITTRDIDAVVGVIYMTMEHDLDRVELLEKLLGVILNLSFVSEAEVIQCGGIVVVIDAMVEHEHTECIQEMGCSIIALLASTENLQVNLCIAETDGIDMIISGLASFPSNERIQVSACKALSHLSIDRESRRLITAQGGVMLVVNAMKTNRDNLDLLEGGCSALLNLSSDADEQVLTDSGVIESVIDIMKYHPDISRLQEKGLGVLQNTSMRNSEAKREIAKLGGIKVVTTVIEEFMGLASVLERAFTTMWSLAVLDSNQVEIANAGGIGLVVNGMMAHVDSDKVQKQACGCLCALAANSRNNNLIREAGGIDAIVYGMWAQYNSEVVLSEACRALSSVVVDVHTNEVVIASEGEINAVISAMRCFPDSARLQENACIALQNLLLSPESVESVRGCADEIGLVVTAAANRFPNQCRDSARQVLRSLT